MRTTIVTKAQLSRELGIGRARLSQLAGLPVRADKMLDRTQALEWLATNSLGPTGEKAKSLLNAESGRKVVSLGTADAPAKVKSKLSRKGRKDSAAAAPEVLVGPDDIARLEAARHFSREQLMELSRADLERLLAIERIEERKMANGVRRGELVRIADVEHSIETRANAERETLLNWPAGVADKIAAKLQVEPRLVHQLLDAEIREHLTRRSSVAVGDDEEPTEAAAV